MNTQLARMYGVLIGTLGVLGLFTTGHLFGLTNSDMALDLLRIVLAGILLYAGYAAATTRVAETALLGVGVLYVVMGLIGLMNPTLGGLLPSGLTGFDVAFHLITGGLAIFGARHHAATTPHRAL
jgi:hypothetical protein